MPPAKRARPSFSPPRPGKSKSKAQATNKDAAPKKRGRASENGTNTTTATKKPKAKPRKRQRTPSPHNSDSLPSSPEDADSHTAASRSLSPATGSSPTTSEADNTRRRDQQEEEEADMMLVEITTTADESETASIPLGLIHRIAAESWQDTTTTKMSTDARRVLGRYVDTFVREAVARCAFEVTDRGGRGGEEEEIGRKGWVDVDDLERVGGVLCLDF